MIITLISLLSAAAIYLIVACWHSGITHEDDSEQ